MSEKLELRCVNTIRAVSADQPEAAGSGHPGAPMGCAPLAHLLWTEFMKFSPKDPNWMARDRFVLSNGHACALQYTMLHLTGYNLTLDDLKQFRQINSKTPGHPEVYVTDGVEVCTGPLGQGISQAVGMAVAEAHMAATFNQPDYKIFDNYTYVICGDGCMQEGIASEAASLAGHLGLGKLIVLYDDNNITIDGDTSLSFTEDVLQRFKGYGWHTQTVKDASKNLTDLRKALAEAQSVTDKPSMIKIKTVIGFGSPSKAGKESAHGAPLGAEDLAGAKKSFGLPPDKTFYIPKEVEDFYKSVADKAEAKRHEWEDLFSNYSGAHPELAAELSRRFARKLPNGLLDKLPVITNKDATRKHSLAVLNAIAPNMPELMGGSADLTPSNLTRSDAAVDFQKETPEGRYMRFGVREHAMVACCNGMFAYGGLRPFCATFLNFFGYCAGAVRISALSKFGIIFVFTHDSIGLGEDGPTHQAIETLESIRAMPGIMMFRPADGNETSGAYKAALQHPHMPSAIALSRQGLPPLDLSSIDKTTKGAYVCVEEGSPDVCLVATGSEVGICVEAAGKLKEQGFKTRVVSMPCQELFLEQSSAYQRSVLPGSVPTLSVEASSPHGWHRFSHAQISMMGFGSSGPGGKVMEYYGFTADNVTSKARELIEFYSKTGSVPDLNNVPPPMSHAKNGH